MKSIQQEYHSEISFEDLIKERTNDFEVPEYDLDSIKVSFKDSKNK